MIDIEFTIGISASGKSSYAYEAFIASHDGNNDSPRVLPIERDILRAMHQSGQERFSLDKINAATYYMNFDSFRSIGVDWSRWKWKNEDAVTKAQRRIITEIVENNGAIALTTFKRVIGKVIVSDTNLRHQRLEQFKSWAGNLGYRVLPDVIFDVPLEEAWKRDSQRKNGVGHDTIFRQWLEFEYQKNAPLIEAAKSRRRRKEVDSVVIFDIDGTLASAETRDIYDWSKVSEDSPIEHVVDIACALQAQGKKLVVVSGRDGVCRADTLKWLKQHGVFPVKLLMRPVGDMRKDTTVKKEILLQEILPKWDVEMVFDDRPSVVRMWQSMGIPTCALGFQHLEF